MTFVQVIFPELMTFVTFLNLLPTINMDKMQNAYNLVISADAGNIMSVLKIIPVKISDLVRS